MKKTDNRFQRFYLDKEKDIIVDLFWQGEELSYVLKTPNHRTGNLINNLAKLCDLPITQDEKGLKIIEGTVPCYIDGYNRTIYIFRLGNTKVANIFPDGTIEMKANIPAISKTLMSQTKDYRLDIKKSIIKTFIFRDCKFRTDLHTHMNAILKPDILIALGIAHQIRYPLYYIKKLNLRCSEEQTQHLLTLRDKAAAEFADSTLTGKYKTRKIDDQTFINFADLILNNPEDAAYNLDRIRASLAVMKDGQAVFTNLEKVYLYRYVFTKGVRSEEPISFPDGIVQEKERPDSEKPVSFPGSMTPKKENLTDKGSEALWSTYFLERIPDKDIASYVVQMLKDRNNPAYRNNTLFQDKLLWIGRSSAACGVKYMEISDTTLVKNPEAADMLGQVHEVMPAIEKETGVVIRFLASIRRIPLTIVRDQIAAGDYFRENLRVLQAVAQDPYVAGSDIIGEEINDIRELSSVIREIVRIAAADPSFVIRIHAGENDSLRDNVANSIACVRESLQPGQKMPRMRIGHGLYAANLKSKRGQELLRELKEDGVVLEFQITSNVRLNNLTSLAHHPLRQYLNGGVRCVQGTDGGALYGTDSIDEQLSLEKLLNLSHEELLTMRHCEDDVLLASLDGYYSKQEAWKARFERDAAEQTDAGRTDEKEARKSEAKADKETTCNTGSVSEDVQKDIGVRRQVAEYYRREIDAHEIDHRISFLDQSKLASHEVLAGRIEELPLGGIPFVLVGGSFNTDHRATSAKECGKRIIDAVLKEADPEKVFFVVGHRLTGYEHYLVEQNRKKYRRKFRIFAIVPTMISKKEEERIKQSGISVRVSIEPSPMGLYKSFAYEIFKRRPSILLALDGNSSGANMIQEANNARHPCRIYINGHARILKAKADSLEGYVTVFTDETEIIDRIIRELKEAERIEY